MALWGNNDAVTSAGIVTLAYTSNDFGGTALTVNGNGTAFNAVGSAQTGDVIRFGLRNGVDGAVYFGDAVISEKHSNFFINPCTIVIYKHYITSFSKCTFCYSIKTCYI